MAIGILVYYTYPGNLIITSSDLLTVQRTSKKIGSIYYMPNFCKLVFSFVFRLMKRFCDFLTLSIQSNTRSWMRSLCKMLVEWTANHAFRHNWCAIFRAFFFQTCNSKRAFWWSCVYANFCMYARRLTRNQAGKNLYKTDRSESKKLIIIWKS